jgi:hypothetical protein
VNRSIQRRRFVPIISTAAIAASLALAGCAGASEQNLAELDNALIANGVDPALTSALEDQILVDPNLVQQANATSVRPPETPIQAPYPAPAGAQFHRASGATGAAAQAPCTSCGPGGAPAPAAGACGAAFQYGREWAERLPAAFPPYPGGRVTEAAGSDAGDCRVRVVTFRTADGWERVLDFYRGVASRAGFSAEHQQRGGDQVLGGVDAAGEGAFYLIVTPIESGSEVALIVNNGR